MSRAVTESMAEGLVTATAEGLIVNANSAARHLFGYRLDDLVGKDVTMLLPTRYRMGFKAFFASLGSRHRGFREWDVKVLGLRHDGIEFPVNVSFGDVNVSGAGSLPPSSTTSPKATASARPCATAKPSCGS
jgi:PAS domain S-box-containing protein